MQTMILLDDVYTLFDSIARGYDVCKIGTIGDAYIVVNKKIRVNLMSLLVLLKTVLSKVSGIHSSNEQNFNTTFPIVVTKRSAQVRKSL